MPGGIARLAITMSVIGPTGLIGPWDTSLHKAITKWTGPFSVPVPDQTAAQALQGIGTGGITTVTGYLISSDREIRVSTNLNVAEILGAGGFHAKAGCSLTSITITNTSGDTAQVTYWLTGD